MIHPQPLSLSSTDRHAYRPLAVSLQGMGGQSAVLPDRASTAVAVCILAVSGHRLQPPKPCQVLWTILVDLLVRPCRAMRR